MSEALFDIDEAAADLPEPAKVTERHTLDLLAQRYTKVSMNAHRYAFAEHVPDRPVFTNRIADFIAVDCWRGSWQRSDDADWGYPIHGHEVKISRSDWLTELRDPDKAEAFRPYCDYWWLVVPDAAIVRAGELPDGWGLMVGVTRLRATASARKAERQAMPRPMTVSLMRAIGKTSRRGSTVGGAA
jgi:hypothetical protein